MTLEPAQGSAPGPAQQAAPAAAAGMGHASVPGSKARFSLFRRFRADKRGATAVEFGLLAFPFFFMLMMIVETSLVFWTRQVLQEATQQASRTILTGQSRTLYTGSTAAQTDAFRQAVCTQMRTTTPADCFNRLFIDVQPMNAFPGNVASIVQGGAIDPATLALRPTGPGEIVIVRTVYTLPVITAGFFSAMSRVGTDNAIEVTVAFRTEPYPTT